MKQHFSTVQDFTEKLAASGLIGSGLVTRVPDEALGLSGTGPTTRASDAVPLVPGLLPSTEQPASVGAGSKRRPPGRISSMRDMRDAIRAAESPLRAVTAGEEATAAISTLHASKVSLYYFADTTPLWPDLAAATTGEVAFAASSAAAAATSSVAATTGPATAGTGPAGKMLSMPLPRPPASTSSSSDRNTGPSATLPAPITALDDDFCILLWKVSLIRRHRSSSGYLCPEFWM